MAKTLTLRNVPDPVVEALRERARRHGRSVQRELLAIVGTAVLDRGTLAERLDAFRHSAAANLSLDEIHDAIEEGRA